MPIFKKSLLLIGFLFLFAASQGIAEVISGFRAVDVPQDESGYHYFESRVINTQEQFETFVKQIKAQEYWSHRDDFLGAIGKANVDFIHESLVLVKHTEGSVSTTVNHMLQLQGDKLICKIETVKPQGAMLGAVADYCFAIVVEKDKVKEVEVRIDDKPGEVLEVT